MKIGVYSPHTVFDVLKWYYKKLLLKGRAVKRKKPEGKGQLSGCQEWWYRKPWALLLCWTLLNKRGNQEKSDKQKNGGTKTARTGLWLVLAGSSLFISMLGVLPFVFLLYGPQRALHYSLHCCLCSRVKEIIQGQPDMGLWSTASRRYMSWGPFWAPQASWSAKTPQQDTQETEAWRKAQCVTEN